jgi:hypothetical protein
MTLFEAIRELKEGQAICGPLDSDERPIIKWYWCNPQPEGTFSRNMRVELHCHDCRIVDLPKPKMTLEEGLYEAAEAIPYELLENPSPRQFTKHFVNKLRSLPIDWQAEADRKEGK